MDETGRASRGVWLLALLSLAGVGAWLRWFWIREQILGGDEWNGLRYATQWSFGEILTRYHKADNCIPISTYYKLLVETVGLSELKMRLPQLVLGTLSVGLFPWMVRPLFTRRVTLLFAALLALSPMLIFYCRFARPYMIVAFLSFVAIFSFHYWIRKRKMYQAILYILCAVACPYFNLFSLAAVVAPLVFVFLLTFFKPGALNCPLPKRSHLVGMGLAVMAGYAAWFLPIYSSLGEVVQKVGGGRLDSAALMGFLNIFNGTGWDGLSLGMAALFAAGAFLLYRQKPFICAFLLFIMGCQAASLVVVRPASMEHGLVFARYAVSWLPLWLLLIAFGLDGFCGWVDGLCGWVDGRISRISGKSGKTVLVSSLLAGVLLVLLYLAGPLPVIYSTPNNFMNHNDYQSNYKQAALEMTGAQEERCSRFYRDLREEPGVTTLIEAPFLPMWWIHLYHLDQRIHGKKVRIGHGEKSFTTQMNQVMHPNMDLRNFVNLHDPEEVRDSGADYIVIHRDLFGEFKYRRGDSPAYQRAMEKLNLDLDRLEFLRGDPARKWARNYLEEAALSLGTPCFEDRWITVFRINK